MIKIKEIRPSDFRSIPWKNGLGVTEEMILEPPQAQFPRDEFDWRLSSAKIQGPNKFSTFAGYERWLIVWQGEGLMVNGQTLASLVPFHFAGEDKIESQPMRGEVKDLGLIYRRSKFLAHLSVTIGPQRLALQNGHQMLFLGHQSQISLNGKSAALGAVLWAQGGGELILETPSAGARTACFEVAPRV